MTKILKKYILLLVLLVLSAASLFVYMGYVIYHNTKIRNIVMEGDLVEIQNFDSRDLRGYSDQYGNTLLFYSKDAAIAEEIIKSGTHVNAKNDYGNTALHFACASLDVHMTDFLISKGADTDAKNMYGERPIDVIIFGFWYPTDYTGHSLYGESIDGSQRLTIFKKLLDSGSNLHNADAPMPLLHSAIRHHDISIMQFLLEQGVPTDILGPNGMTALDYAKSNNKPSNWIQLLESYLPEVEEGVPSKKSNDHE